MKSIYFISGASGSGKSSLIPELQKILGDTYKIFEFDSVGVPQNADTVWRKKTTELWLRKILEEKKNVILVGQMVIGELLACPSALKIPNIHYYFLDVADEERKRRLKQRGDTPDEHTFLWAEWLRQHHKNPQHKQHVIKDIHWSELNFSRWDSLATWEDHVIIECVDTTDLSLQNVALRVAKGITQ